MTQDLMNFLYYNILRGNSIPFPKFFLIIIKKKKKIVRNHPQNFFFFFPLLWFVDFNWNRIKIQQFKVKIIINKGGGISNKIIKFGYYENNYWQKKKWKKIYMGGIFVLRSHIFPNNKFIKRHNIFNFFIN